MSNPKIAYKDWGSRVTGNKKGKLTYFNKKMALPVNEYLNAKIIIQLFIK